MSDFRHKHKWMSCRPVFQVFNVSVAPSYFPEIGIGGVVRRRLEVKDVFVGRQPWWLLRQLRRDRDKVGPDRRSGVSWELLLNQTNNHDNTDNQW